MALTELIQQPEARRKFNSVCNISRLKFNSGGQSAVRPAHKSYALVGKAFDYAVRFWLEAEQLPLALSGTWIAEQSFKLLRDEGALFKSVSESFSHQKLVNWLENCLAKARAMWRLYLVAAQESETVSRPDDAILRMCLFLGELDNYYRAGNFDENILRAPLHSEVADLRALLKLVPRDQFIAAEQLVLNPSFGSASSLVGGADADLILDDCLIDFKTSQYFTIKPEQIWQIIGYQALALQHGIYAPLNEREWNINPHSVQSGALYFARFGKLIRWNFSDVIADSDFYELGKWLIDYGKEFYALTDKRLN